MKKNKFKTKKAAAKRFKLKKSGKVARTKAFSNHILTKKSKGRKRGYRKAALVDLSSLKTIKKCLGH